MRLDVELITQDEKTVDCGLACVSMVMAYHGVEKSIPDLAREVDVKEKVGTYMPQLGTCLLRNGFSAEMVTMNPFAFTRSMADLPKDELSDHLFCIYKETQKDDLREAAGYFIEFLEEGGALDIKVPTVDDIVNELDAGRPSMTLLTSHFLLNDRPAYNFHFNVITGLEDGKVHVNDPLWNFMGGKKSYPVDDFMYGIHAGAFGALDHASIMRVRPY